jgi:hypothetical protein
VTGSGLTRRKFNHSSLASLQTAAASAGAAASAQQEPAFGSSARCDVIKQELPGEPPRDLILVEVTYPHNGSPPYAVCFATMLSATTGSARHITAMDIAMEPHFGQAPMSGC